MDCRISVFIQWFLELLEKVSFQKAFGEEKESFKMTELNTPHDGVFPNNQNFSTL